MCSGSMLESWVTTAATASPVARVQAIATSSLSRALFSSTWRSETMLRVIRFQAHRRLLRRPDIRHDQRFFKQMELLAQIPDYPTQTYEPCIPHDLPRVEGLPTRMEAGPTLKERKAIGLHAFRSYFPATHASLADAPFRRFKKEQEALGRRSRLRMVNLNSKKRIIGDAAVGPSTQVRELSYHTSEQFSDDELGYYDDDETPHFVDMDGWRWRLNRFLQRDGEQEIVTKEKKDRRDYEHIQPLIKQMGLHCQLYSKVLVISKIPLPNYRPDLDDRRPQRQVMGTVLYLAFLKAQNNTLV